MAASVLVAYATRYGSTKDVAEAVAETLRNAGLDVDVRPIREVDTVEGYSSIVLGAPLYIGRLLGDFHNFLTKQHDALAQRPVAVFALGPTAPDERQFREAREQLDVELRKHPWLTPVATEMFGGKYDPSRLSFSHKLLAALPVSPLHGLPASDARDWTAIRAWAADLAGKLQAPSPR